MNERTKRQIEEMERTALVCAILFPTFVRLGSLFAIQFVTRIERQKFWCRLAASCYEQQISLSVRRSH